jgi:hypothetical protein
MAIDQHNSVAAGVTEDICENASSAYPQLTEATESKAKVDAHRPTSAEGDRV